MNHVPPAADPPTTQGAARVAETAADVAGAAVLGAVRSTIVATISDVSELADKGASNFLLGLGTALLVIGVAMQIEIESHGFADLQSSEFIVLVVLGSLIVALGAALRLYAYRTERAVTDNVTRAAVEWLNQQGRVAEKILTPDNPPQPPSVPKL
jgi:hypothetical protein